MGCVTETLGYMFIFNVSDQNLMITNIDFIFYVLEVQCLHFLEQETIKWKLPDR